MRLLFVIVLTLFTSCSPLRTSPHDERHQWELKLHEVQTNLNDLHHDINCFQTELQILDGRIKYDENALATIKQKDLEKQQAKLDHLSHQLQALERKCSSLEKSQGEGRENLEKLLSHAHETTLALSQYKERIRELEQSLHLQDRRFEELAKLKSSIEALVKSLQGHYKIYRVRQGDTLKKIANVHQVRVEKLRSFNSLDSDLIFPGQELKIPLE